ncbi:MAG: hypothetical protein JW717_05285 [Marinilabiliaceae bacterium]|nr:hypothetical protein [Marinilabiliaceae bacterium]
MAEKKATEELDKILFCSEKTDKTLILKTIHEITKNRLTDDEAMDYFLKIKGLQVINLSDPISYWTRKFLMSPTKIRLNYFEQVKFYETFLNFPEVNGRVFKKVDNSPLSRFPLTEAAQELIKRATLLKRLA